MTPILPTLVPTLVTLTPTRTVGHAPQMFGGKSKLKSLVTTKSRKKAPKANDDWLFGDEPSFNF